MPIRSSRFRSLLLCVVLQIGVILGVPMRPDEIQKLMRMLSGAAVVQTLPAEDDNGDGGTAQTDD
jgi:hypothetical protein